MPTPFPRVAALALALLSFAFAWSAHAIPAFARRYATSCQTCHVAYPKLTPFGEAFRRTGYRFPGGGDATAVKEEPVALGNEAMREIWPNAVWPGELPGQLPLSVIVDGSANYGPHPEGMAHGHGAAAMPGMVMPEGELGFAGLGGHVGLRAGGPLGDGVSVFASVDVGGMEPIAVERSWVDFQPAGPTALHIRLGRFEPTLHGVSVHRGLLAHQLRLTTTAVGANPFSPEHSATGAELSGVALGRIGWAAGVVENAAGDRMLRKDVYGRAEYKFGGMRLDGLQAEAATAAWRERSLLLGVSGWSGRAAIMQSGMPLHDDDFMRVGADLHIVFDNLMLDLVAVQEDHEQPTVIANTPQTLQLALAELTYMVHAFAFPTFRLEASRRDDTSDDTRWLATAMVTTVIRPNVLLRLAGEIGADAKPDDHTDFRSAVLSFAAAF